MDYGDCMSSWRFEENWQKIGNQYKYKLLDAAYNPVSEFNNYFYKPKPHETYAIQLASVSLLSENEVRQIKFRTLEQINHAAIEKIIPEIKNHLQTVHFFKDGGTKELATPIGFLKAKENGACFFESLSLALVGNVGLAKILRKSICDYMKGMEVMFYKFCGGNAEQLEQYVAQQRKPYEWADGFTIVCAAALLDINILIFYNETERQWRCVTPWTKKAANGNVYLNYQQSHYDAIVQVTQKRELHFFDLGNGVNISKTLYN